MNTFSHVEQINLPTEYGQFKLSLYKTKYDSQPDMRYVVVVYSESIPKVPIMRMHSSCLFSEIFKTQLCDCFNQLDESLKMIAKNGGILFYLDQEGRGHGLDSKIKESKLQEKGYDTVEASQYLQLMPDARQYDVIIDILKLMKISKVQLITNNPIKINALENGGIQVIKRISLPVKINAHNKNYILTKQKKFHHFFGVKESLSK